MYLRYVLKRLAYGVPLILGVVCLNFVLIHLAPGDPVNALVGDFPAPAEYVERLRVQFGLDQPLHVQLWHYLQNVFQGDFGYSFAKRQPVLNLIVERLLATLLLMGAAVTLSAVFGILVAYVAAAKRNGPLDRFARTGMITAYSTPDFWVGQVLILVFAVYLGWFPFQGMRSLSGVEGGSLGSMLDLARHLVLPATAISLRLTASTGRVARSSMLDAMDAKFVRAARSRGVTERSIRIRHGLRNASPPIITVIGYDVGLVLGGAAVVETVFGWPGIGRLMYESVNSRDTPVLLAILLFVSISVLVANLITDVLHARIDPRVRV